MSTGAEREVRQPDRHHSSRLTRGETSVGGLRAVVLLQFYVSSIALVYTVLMLRKSTNRIHSDKVTKFMGSGSISKAVTVHFATACRPSVTVLVEIRAGYLGCMPVCILWRHAGMHVYREFACQCRPACRPAFSIFRIILTNHGLGADNLSDK